MAVSAQLVVSDELGCLRLIEVPAGPRWETTAMTRRITQPARVKGDAGAGITCMTPDPLLPGGWRPGAQAIAAVGRADGRADIVALSSGRVLASARAPARAAADAARAQAPRPQRDIKHEQLADDPRRVVALAFFVAGGGGGGGEEGDGAGKTAGKKKGSSSSSDAKAAAAAAAASDPWPRLLVLHGTGLACVYRLGPELLQQQPQQQQQQHEAAASAPGAEALPNAARAPPLEPEATFQTSLNARCASLDPGAASAVRAWRLPEESSAAGDQQKQQQQQQRQQQQRQRRPPLLAVGAEGTALSLYDLSARRRVWQAKSPKPNRTGLPERPHHTAVAFVPGVPEQTAGEGGGAAAAGAGAGAGSDGEGPPIPRFVLLVGTAAHTVHAYDTAVGKRPQASAEWGLARITAIVPQRGPGEEAAGAGAGADFWACDGMGRAGALELRGLGPDGAPAPKAPDGSGGLALRTPNAGAAQGVLRGAAGSVRAIAVLSAGRVAGLSAAAEGKGSKGNRAGGPREVVAVAGLDRHVRLYDARTHLCVGRVYAKQQLTGAVWVPPAVAAVRRGASAAAAAAAEQQRGADEDEEEEEEEAPREAKKMKKEEKKTANNKSSRRGGDDGGEGERRNKKKKKKVEEEG